MPLRRRAIREPKRAIQRAQLCALPASTSMMLPVAFAAITNAGVADHAISGDARRVAEEAGIEPPIAVLDCASEQGNPCRRLESIPAPESAVPGDQSWMA